MLLCQLRRPPSRVFYLRLSRSFRLSGSHFIRKISLSDDDVERIARCSILHLDRSSPDFASIKRDLESVASLLLQVHSQSTDGVLAVVEAPSQAAAAARIEILRRDDEEFVVSRSTILGHATSVEDGYYKAPAFD